MVKDRLMALLVLSDSEFGLFQKMIYDKAGINLANSKKSLVSARLTKRVKHYDLPGFIDYFKLIVNNSHNELQVAIDLLTTNETYFFREHKHFDFLRDKVFPEWLPGVSHRIWSAASSSGEEAYTLAMLLAEHAVRGDWEIVGTDISSRMIERARTAIYPLMRAEKIPPKYLNRYCLKGTGLQEGSFIISKALRDNTIFLHANLQESMAEMGMFDIILLRNVLIYFDAETKKHVVSNLVKQLKQGGYIIVGHSESLSGISDNLTVIAPSIYRKL
jgi:chemotaxis protein methyltransferase CheR